ncbi:MAG: site-2 protease family protein [bacterium]|nr:site-2 protease family protein [bacterium]
MDDIESLVSDCINVEEHSYRNGIPVICGTLLIEAEQAFKLISDRLKGFNLLPVFRKKEGKIELRIVELPKIREEKRWVNLVLLIATVITTVFAGSFLSGVNPFENLKYISYGIPFSFTLLLILGSHELGHYFACRHRNISATLPYFIPVPPPIFPLGTFGAIIRIKAPISDKKGLVEVGAAGPVTGFIMAIPITIIGLKLSKFIPASQIKGAIFLGNSLLFWTLTKLFASHPPIGYELSLHPIAFSGWVGMFVTAINLLPLGQLDGGHISYALLGERVKFIPWIMIGLMLALGIYWPGWWMWSILILVIIGIKHPPPLNSITQLDLQHRIIGVIALFIFVITFIPVPFRV